MSKTPLLSIRCPLDLLTAIEKEVNETTRSKTDVVVRRLRLAYGLTEETPPPSVMDEMQKAIATLQQEVDGLKKPLAL